MSILKYFKNTPGRPIQALSVKFFVQIRNEVPVKKTLSPPQRATGACRPAHGRPLGPAHGRGRGACRPPPWATGVSPSI